MGNTSVTKSQEGFRDTSRPWIRHHYMLNWANRREGRPRLKAQARLEPSGFPFWVTHEFLLKHSPVNKSHREFARTSGVPLWAVRAYLYHEDSVEV